MMQKDITSVSGELSCLELAKILDDKRISGVPVVSADGALVGVVSKTDLLRKYIELSEANDSGATLADFKVHEIMSPDSLTVEPGEDLEAVADKMINRHVHRVLVRNGCGEISGIVTSFDLFRAVRLGNQLFRWNELRNDGASGADLPAEDDVVGTLSHCCSRSLPLVIIPLEETTCYSALFATVSEGGVVVSISRELGEALFRVLSFCLICFSVGAGSKAFFAQVRDWKREDGEKDGELRLELPSRILTTQRRPWFRVPLIGEHGLKVQVATKDQRSWPVTPIDIGMGGILIRFPKGEDPELEIGTEVTVEMRLSTDTVRLAGSVRHRRPRLLRR